MVKAKRSVKAIPQRRLFVLDTNVLMHDPTSIFRFDEHDIFIPMIVLEELDQMKKGLSDVARNARQSSRFLDELISQADLSGIHWAAFTGNLGGVKDYLDQGINVDGKDGLGWTPLHWAASMAQDETCSFA